MTGNPGTVPPSRTLKLTQRALTVFGVLALGYCAAVFLEAKLYQIRKSKAFASQLRRKQADKPAQVNSVAPVPALEKHGVLARLEIPRLGLTVMVVEGVDDVDLKRAAGHIPGTALPWDGGNVGIAGHRDTFFRPLHAIQRDDSITVSALRGTYRYLVVSTSVVSPQDVQVLYPTERDSLTLVTCFPFEYVGSAPKRFIVRAERATGM